MKQKTLNLGLLTAGAVTAALVASQFATATPQSDRRLSRRPGVSLEQQVKPGDRNITIVDEAPPPLIVLPPAGVSSAEWITEVSQLIFVVQARQARSTLTPEGDFIQTKVTAEIEEVIKQPGATFRPGTTIHFTLPGGHLTVNGVEVKGEVPWARGVKKGGRYLVLGALADDGELVVGPTSMYQVDVDGSAERLADVPGEQDLKDIPAQAFLNDVRAAAIAKGRPY